MGALTPRGVVGRPEWGEGRTDALGAGGGRVGLRANGVHRAHFAAGHVARAVGRWRAWGAFEGCTNGPNAEHATTRKKRVHMAHASTVPPVKFGKPLLNNGLSFDHVQLQK